MQGAAKHRADGGHRGNAIGTDGGVLGVQNLALVIETVERRAKVKRASEIILTLIRARRITHVGT